MALKSTIFKADLQIADMDRNYYQGHSLTLARHPSETDERMMVRLLAFALFADERLEFGRGLSADDEPALWRKDLTGAIELWIEVGLPDERELRKACGRAERVVVLCYGGRGAELWWDRTARSWRACATWPCSPCRPRPRKASRLGQPQHGLQCTIQDGQLWLTDGKRTVHVEPRTLQEAR